MALNNLRVSDVADLRTEASNFQQHADDIKTTTNHMLEIVGSTVGNWRGEAQARYTKQFEDLRDDMQRLYEMCTNYCTDLNDIATNYENAESDNVSTASALQADIVMSV